ncbi:MAG: 4'-phosphopantetheinyl transferase superfamily protein [Pseudomonadota bacterium]
MSDTREVPSGETHTRRYQVLSPEEQIAADRFMFPSDSQTFVAAHCLLRQVLSHHLNRSPETLRFGRGSHGRPYLLGNMATNFNLSHTKGLVACAVYDRAIGVDVEQLRDNIDIRALSRRVLSKNEQDTLSFDKPPSQTRFFDYWTVKEAYSKARGLGITMPFRYLDFAISDQGVFEPDLSHVDDKADNWCFEVYQLQEGFRVALAAKKIRDVSIRLHFVDPFTLTSKNVPTKIVAAQKMNI